MVHLYIIYNVNPSFLVWHNNTIKNLACIYYPTTSMIQKSAHGLAWPLVKLKLRFWPGLSCSHRLNSGAFKLYMLIAFSFLQTASLWAPISCWLSVRGHLSSLPRGPLWSANPTMEACSFRDSHRTWLWPSCLLQEPTHTLTLRAQLNTTLWKPRLIWFCF